MTYGPHERNRLDFLPRAESKRLVVVIHGGFRYRFNKSFRSHPVLGPVALGWSAVVISYPLAPEVTIPAIARSAAKAVNTAAEMAAGPILLAGHSRAGLLQRALRHRPNCFIQRFIRASGLRRPSNNRKGIKA